MKEKKITINLPATYPRKIDMLDRVCSALCLVDEAQGL